MTTGSPPTLAVGDQRPDPATRRRPRRLPAAVAAALALLFVAAVPAAHAQEEPGLTCDSANPAPGDTLACGAGGLQQDEAFEWTAEFATGDGAPEELSGEGTVDEAGEAHFEVVVPDDADGDFDVEVSSDGDMDSEADYTFAGTVQAPEDENENEEDDTTTTTEPDDTTTTTTDDVDLVDDSDVSDDVAVAGVETSPQVEMVPTGGVATGVGPPESSRFPAGTAAFVLATVTGLLTLVWRRRRAGGHSA